MLPVVLFFLELILHLGNRLSLGRLYEPEEGARFDVVDPRLCFRTAMPGHLSAGSPAVDSPRRLGRIRSKQHLEEFLSRFLLGTSAAYVPAADVVFSSPKQQQAHAGGHHVVILSRAVWHDVDGLESRLDQPWFVNLVFSGPWSTWKGQSSNHAATH